jgi:hypothetical protein
MAVIKIENLMPVPAWFLHLLQRDASGWWTWYVGIQRE